DDVANGGAARKSGGGVGLAALDADVEFVEFAFRALQLGGPLHILLGLDRSLRDGCDVALALDRKSRNRLAGLGNSVDDPLRPSRFDADDDGSGHVGVGAGADHGTEEELEIFAELQAAVG